MDLPLKIDDSMHTTHIIVVHASLIHILLWNEYLHYFEVGFIAGEWWTHNTVRLFNKFLMRRLKNSLEKSEVNFCFLCFLEFRFGF